MLNWFIHIFRSKIKWIYEKNNIRSLTQKKISKHFFNYYKTLLPLMIYEEIKYSELSKKIKHISIFSYERSDLLILNIIKKVQVTFPISYYKRCSWMNIYNYNWTLIVYNTMRTGNNSSRNNYFERMFHAYLEANTSTIKCIS